MRHEGALRSSLKQLLLQRNVKTVKQLIALHEIPGPFSHLPVFMHFIRSYSLWIGAFYSWCAAMFFISKLMLYRWLLWNCYILNKCSYADVSVPRYVRVNTLKLDVDSALLELQKNYSVNSSKYFWWSTFYILVKMFTSFYF